MYSSSYEHFGRSYEYPYEYQGFMSPMFVLVIHWYGTRLINKRLLHHNTNTSPSTSTGSSYTYRTVLVLVSYSLREDPCTGTKSGRPAGERTGSAIHKLILKVALFHQNKAFCLQFVCTILSACTARYVSQRHMGAISSSTSVTSPMIWSSGISTNQQHNTAQISWLLIYRCVEDYKASIRSTDEFLQQKILVRNLYHRNNGINKYSSMLSGQMTMPAVYVFVPVALKVNGPRLHPEQRAHGTVSQDNKYFAPGNRS
eukprot:scaffold291910_cov38-Prasinocladus_malaysianus.AAC.1